MGASTASTPKKAAAAGVDIQTSSEGVAIPVVYGRARISPNLMWLGKLAHLGGDIGFLFFPTPGSGFGAASPATANTYYYFISMMLGLCEGPIRGVRTIYKRDTLYRVKDYDVVVNGVVQSSNFGGSIHIGTGDQPPWTKEVAEVGRHTLSLANKGAGKAPAPPRVFPWLAYMGRQLWPLYQQAQLPNLTMEVFGLACDATLREPFMVSLSNETGSVGYEANPKGEPIGANPADIAEDLLTDPIHGIGFPPEMLGDLADYRTACHAHGFLLSLAAVEQQEAEQYLTGLLDQSNATARFSDGVLQLLPLWDSATKGPALAAAEHQLTHTPAWLVTDGQDGWKVQVVYALTDSDFLPNTWVIERPDPADAFNVHVVEYTNRYSTIAGPDSPKLPEGESAPGLYETATTEAADLAAIELFGRRDADVFNAHYITDEPTAQALASVRCQNAVANPNRHTFDLPGWRYARLDEGDLVSVPPDVAGGPPTIVRVEAIEEDEDEILTVSGVEVVTGLHTEVLYSRQGAIEEGTDYDADPGKIAEPVLFEPMAAMSGGDLELWIAATGQSDQWGGCTVWMSEDGGVDYRPVGQIVQRATMGKLQAALPELGATLDVRWTAPAGEVIEIETFTEAEGRRLTSALYIDGGSSPVIPYEVVGYSVPTLTAPNRYNLELEARAGFGTTAQIHRQGANVVRLDEAVLKLQMPERLVERTGYVPLYFKFTSFNRFGGAEQSLEDVAPVIHILQGVYLRSPVGPIANLASAFVEAGGGSRLYLSWDGVTDLRGTVDYEIRRGSQSWARAVVIGATRETRFEVVADAVYWVAARVSITRAGVPQYIYGAPSSIAIKATVSSVDNVIGAHDEFAGQFADYAALVRADQPAAYWRLGNHPKAPFLRDDTGAVIGSYVFNSLVGALSPGATSAALSGVYFQHANDRILLNAASLHDLTADEWTVGLWFKWESGSGRQHLYSKGSGAWLSIESGGALRWLSAAGGSQILGSTPVRDGAWHLALLTFRRYDPSTGVEERRLRLFLDGKPEGEAVGATFPVATGNTWLGNQGSPIADNFNAGFIDDYFTLPRAVSDNTAASLYRAGTTYAPATYVDFVRKQQPLVYVRFTEANGEWSPEEIVGYHLIPPDNTDVAGLLPGDANRARSFNGSTDVIVGPGLPFPAGATQFAFEAIVRAGVVADQWLVGISDEASLTSGPYVELLSTGAIRAHWLTGAGMEVVTTPAGTYQAADPFHLYADHTSSTLRIFVDGVLRASAAATGQTILLDGGNVILGHGAPGPGFFDGVLDEVAVYTPRLIVVDGNLVSTTQPSTARILAHAEAAQTGKMLTGLTVDPATGHLYAAPLTTGYFQVPDAHIVTLPRRMLCRITVGWDAAAVGPNSIRDVPDVQALGQVNVLDAAPLIVAQPEISISDELTGDDWNGGGTRLEWAPFRPANYLAARVRLRFKLGSLSAGILAALRALTWSVDVPDTIQRGTVTTSAAGTVTLAYPKAFAAVAGNPNLVVSMRGAGGNPEVIRVTNETPTGFTVDVVTIGGARVVRELTWIAAGF